MREKKPNSLDLLNDALRQNPTFAALADAVTRVTRRLLDEPRWKLERIRHSSTVQRGDLFDTEAGTGKVSVIRRVLVDPDTGVKTGEVVDEVEVDLGGGKAVTVPMRTIPERGVMISNAAMLGFNFFSDELSDDDLQRIQRYVAAYWPHSGDANFIRFLSYVKNTRFEIRQLVTPSYGDPLKNAAKEPYLYLEHFRPDMETWMHQRPSFGWDKPEPPEGFGGVYPTSHVELTYDILEFPNPDFRGSTELFYFLAPIHLVLERFSAEIFAPRFDLFAAAKAAVVNIQHAQYSWSPDAEITTFGELVSHVNQIANASLYLSDEFTNAMPLPEE